MEPEVRLGYPNSNAIYLAFGRGEEGAKILVGQSRRPDLPNVRTFNEMLGDKKPTGDKWRAFLGWTGPSAVDKYFALRPKTPDKFANILRASFKATAESKEFQKNADNVIGEGYSILSGAETAELIEGAVKVTPGVVAGIDRLKAKYGLPKVQRATAR